ncbi:hypothetical protein San01_11510 [Streptomyces angustmyceticus]|uniref:Uncharacterized protein n=1 Tax=Streptomyces angustmyceticus TaxID=285578 RepID=A0A5J4L7E2_9ACTN|nr:hypothetical protein San01_11510 [Streptomyces angustmyceticus]
MRERPLWDAGGPGREAVRTAATALLGVMTDFLAGAAAATCRGARRAACPRAPVLPAEGVVPGGGPCRRSSRGPESGPANPVAERDNGRCGMHPARRERGGPERV